MEAIGAFILWGMILAFALFIGGLFLNLLLMFVIGFFAAIGYGLAGVWKLITGKQE